MKSKIFGLVFAGIFAFGFGVGGVLGGLMPLWDAAQTYVRASSLVPVAASLNNVQLVSGDSKTRGVRAEYSYTWQGERYASDRVSLQQSARGADNLGDWHQRWFNTLDAAYKNKTTVTAWINPNDPTDAVLDKDIRWAKVWFAIPFATLFTGVGLVAAYIFVKILFAKENEFVSQHGKPVELEKNASRIRANSSVGLFFFGLVWSLLAVPMCVMLWSSQNDATPRVIVSILASLGVWMMVHGLSSAIRSRKSASPTISLFPQQPEFGEAFRVRIHVPNRRGMSMPTAIAIALAETVRDERGSTTATRAGLQRSFVAKRASSASSTAQETIYEADIEPPSDGHASGGPSGGMIYSWTLEIAKSASVNAFSFPIALNPAASQAAKFQKIAIDTPKDFIDSYRDLRRSNSDALTTFVPEDVCKITQQGREWQADFPARGLTAEPLTALLIAVAAIAWFAYNLIYAPGDVAREPILTGLAALIGFCFLAIALHFATRRFRVHISPTGLFAQRESTLLTHRLAVPLAHLKNFSSVRKYTQTTNGRSQEQFSAIHAFETKNDLHHRVTPTLGGIGAIDALTIEMNDALDNVRQYGIAPAPRDNASLYSPLHRVVSWAMLVLFATLLAATTYALLYQRQRLFTPLAYAGAEPHPVELTAAQFVPADPKRHDAIMEAIDRDDVAAMKQLLAQGIDPNTEAHHGSSLLHMAVSKETMAMMEALLEGGADVNRVVTRGRQLGGTPLSVATYHGNAKLMAQLIARGARPRGLVYYGWEYANLAAFSGCIDCLKLLKREGIDLDAFAPGGRRETPIMTAARYGKLDAIRFLAGEGASVTKRDQHGYNVMGWAHFFRQDAAKKLLLELGADPDMGVKTAK
jgi:ankyrin repeat protein